MEGVADYTFVEERGEAGHGTVYLARAPERLDGDGRLVQVKVFRGIDDDETLGRATKELRAFAAVRSPYVVRLLDAGRDDDRFFYAIEHSPGGSLAAPTVELDRGQLVAALAQASRGLHAVHEAGLVHRGVNPSNILLSADGTARLSDLGLARAFDAATSMSGLGPVGQVEYLDPTVLAGEPATPASDLWSMGATLHRVLTGVGLYGDLPSDDPLLAVRRVLTRPPRLGPGLRPGEERVILRCLAEQHADRPATALDLAEELERLG